MAAMETLPAPSALPTGRWLANESLSGDTYGFADFRLSLAQRRLRRGDTPVALNPRAFDLLVALVRAPGQVVSREDLLRQVWGGLAVQESNLTVNMCLLRRALQAHGGGGLIGTIPGRGYQFLAPVTVAAEPATRVAIETFQRVGDPDRFVALAEALPPTLTAALSQIPGVSVCTDGPHWRLQGCFQELQGTVRVSLRLARSATGDVAWAEQRLFAPASSFELHDAIAAWLQAALASLLRA